MSRIETIGDATLYLGDCREILPTLGKFDAAVTDPPYGIGADEAASKNNGKWGWKYYGESAWDRNRPESEVFAAILSCSKHQIIWGGNYFTDLLPPSMQWFIWDKGQRDFSLADFEMAWSSQQKAARIIDYPRGRALLDGKEHPTQKPVEVMRYCINALPAKSRTIVDPFMGSGTTGMAALSLGRQFTGIEVNPTYFDIACRRVESAHKSPDMFAQVERRAEEIQQTIQFGESKEAAE
jgi:DNA modification methylase